jgi:hypothetical protein
MPFSINEINPKMEAGLSEKFQITSIQPLGSTALDGSVPLDKVPEEVISRFLGQQYSLKELEDLGVQFEGAHYVYPFGGCRYLLNFASASGKS